MSDDVGITNLSAYSRGMAGYHTPNIDRIGNEGVLFTDYYAEQSCTAGRSAFITGQSPIRTGLAKVGFPGATIGLQKEDPTLAEMLKPLGYATGIRRNEVLNITLKDIDRKRGLIKIAGKGKKQREVPLSSNLLNLLEEYYRRYRPSVFLFEGYVSGKTYSSRSVDTIVKRATLKAGIKKNISPHILRHSFATHMLEKGINLKRLQLLLGHSSMKTTSVYLHMADIDKVQLPDLITDID